MSARVSADDRLIFGSKIRLIQTGWRPWWKWMAGQAQAVKKPDP